MVMIFQWPPGVASWIPWSPRFHTLVAVAAILLMAVSQLCELLDRWDTIADIGYDSEFMFIVIGMCIALCLFSALLIVRLAKIVFRLSCGSCGVCRLPSSRIRMEPTTCYFFSRLR
jgi:heterodisulfide reductase subunit A-like polyferredoxin